MPKSLRLISWNVNGVRAACKKGLVSWTAKESPDILCLQETKADPSQVPAELSNLDGYAAQWDWPHVKKGYSGVATLSRPKPEWVRRGLGLKEFDSEGRTLVSRYPGFTLYNIYFPNGKKDETRLKFKLDFYDAFLETVERDRAGGERGVVVCGDFNTAHKEIDLARPKENRTVSGFLDIERAWMDKFVAAGFIDAFREFEGGPGHYTWWDLLTRARERNVGWRIDYFFISKELRPKLKRSFILPEAMGSDHCPVGIELAA